jgi:nicotinamide mononucleotide transporter
MTIYYWLSNNWVEIFGAVTGIIYVFLEIRQNIWLWPVGIVTSAVYILVFFTSKFYADMGLQVYYLVISIVGWYWWVKGAGPSFAEATENNAGSLEDVAGSKNSPFEGGRALKNDPVDHFSEEPAPHKRGARLQGQGDVKLIVTRLKPKTGLILAIIFVVLYFLMWFILSRLTDSPVPEWDSFITSLSIVATWMLARKIYEHWFLWIAVNSVASLVFLSRGLYPTVILYLVYLAMSFAGLKAWKRSL